MLCLSVCLYTHHTLAWCPWKPGEDSLELELQTAVSHNAGACNGTQVFRKSSKCFEPWSHLSSLYFTFLRQGITKLQTHSAADVSVNS